jgi:hypothetical protein
MRIVAAQVDAHPSANGVAVGRVAVAEQFQAKKMMAWRSIVREQLHFRTGSIGGPQVQVAVMVPIDQGVSASVADMVEPGDRRDVGEPAFPGVQETTVSLAAAQRQPFPDEFQSAGVRLFKCDALWRRRIDGYFG